MVGVSLVPHLPEDEPASLGSREVFEILAAQNADRQVLLPLASMVSDDTDEGIRELLAQTGRFGLEESQVVILKQEKVAALADSDARLALKSDFEARRAAPAAPRPPRAPATKMILFPNSRQL